MQILIATQTPELWRKHFAVSGVDYVADLPEPIAAALPRGYAAVHCERPPATVPPKTLRLVQLGSAGSDQMVGHPWLGLVPEIASSAGVCAHFMAEHIVAMALSWEKKLSRHRAHQKSACWPNRSQFGNTSLRGRTALIVGYGAVGRVTARHFRGFGTNVIAVNRSGRREPFSGWLPAGIECDLAGDIPSATITTADLGQAVGAADFVILCIALNAGTRGLITRDVLAGMKSDAVLINVARGGLVRDDDLAAALARGTPAHAFLDVFGTEPLPPESPWWAHPSVTVTPHISGVMPLDEVVRHQAELFRRNLDRLHQGLPVLNRVRVA
jgi:phosphoglycerate dehydrogenase-like enzyme